MPFQQSPCSKNDGDVNHLSVESGDPVATRRGLFISRDQFPGFLQFR